MAEGLSLQKILKPKSAATSTPSKALAIRINLILIALFLVIYAALLLKPSSSVYFNGAASRVRCSLRECHHPKVENGHVKMKTVLEDQLDHAKLIKHKGNVSKLEMPSFFKEFIGKKSMKIGLINIEEEEISGWKANGYQSMKTIPVGFEQVSENFKWEHLFPEWIDEEEESDVDICPMIPMPDFPTYRENVDVIVAKLPCKYPEEGWAREVFRLQVHLIATNMAVKRGKRSSDWNRKTTKIVFWSKCRPMLELFRCDDLVRHDGDWWFFQPDMPKLEQKVSLPAGTCQLALPLWGQGINEIYDLSKIRSTTKSVSREAYATVLHSSESYVCGAIALAQSLLQTGTQRDLILLIDDSISVSKRNALVASGWKIRFITRIRNPRAEKGTYNEYNYSKFRLWQLTEYDKVIFIDADIIVLRNLDLLFHFPQMTATGNDVWLFNSGIMVIEPSNCTFQILMDHRDDIVSYNGGDQGFLNEVFVWWHRLPRRVNFLKNFWSNTTTERCVKEELFGADPPKVYAVHYLGLKPWNCYRDYDCNWDVEDQRVYASDVAHRRWWTVHDGMDVKLQRFCGLNKVRRTELNWERRKARKMSLPDGHWKINITDPRRHLHH